DAVELGRHGAAAPAHHAVGDAEGREDAAGAADDDAVVGRIVAAYSSPLHGEVAAVLRRVDAAHGVRADAGVHEKYVARAADAFNSGAGAPGDGQVLEGQ